MTENDLPGAAGQLAENHPDVWKAFEAFGKACSEAGPIESRSRHLIKIAIAVAIRSEGATHSHVRRALEDGVSAAEIRHACMLAAPTAGFPQAVAGLTWAQDIIDGA
jgi:alkylhydroperoxidase/carboxymuconolactone decarboxylase family protein YurZ